MEITSTGRRKTAAASVRMVAGSGKITVNGVAFEKYFETEALRGYIMQPLKVCNSETAFDISANIKGGGKAGQAGALRHGIARSLVKENEDFKPVLKDCGMLTRDAREKERKKSGQPGARKRFQFSKR
ncbi:MAG: 30S ribosomal protein S9 [Lentisphaeria bacterium]|nr:30S ribosomal protein S9 [Lentisphaerota bacterium]MBO5201878.1 30S ribosomal protein S9 [Lentisphaeria bacterium]MBO5695207.1 30S ribosomal protein S9 [Lentisphaeria bacterium]MBO5802190.1 30S ribosomal protein S9 [Lentisphaeria bacterium]MBR4076449.1 30S ribosomal protein S9 [Lentisphaeria bacterium]